MRSLINHLLLQGVQELIKYQWFTANFVSVFTREERDKLTILHSELCKSEQQSALGQRFFQDCAHYAFPIIIKQARTHAHRWDAKHVKFRTILKTSLSKMDALTKRKVRLMEKAQCLNSEVIFFIFVHLWLYFSQIGCLQSHITISVSLIM